MQQLSHSALNYAYLTQFECSTKSVEIKGIAPVLYSLGKNKKNVLLTHASVQNVIERDLSHVGCIIT